MRGNSEHSLFNDPHQKRAFIIGRFDAVRAQ